MTNGQIAPGAGLGDLRAGHGTFVAGVVERVAQACTIVVYRAVDTQGTGTSHDVANAIVQAARDGADIINVSLGARTVDNLPPVAFTTAVDTMPRAARRGHRGQRGQHRAGGPDVPGGDGEEGVVGVGALTADG